jgi:protein SCO1/2
VRLAAAVLALTLAIPAAAHDDHDHAKPPPATAKGAVPAGGTGLPVSRSPFPVQIDGRFSLIDQDGVARTERDYRGRHALVFFGYANCQGICSVALPRIAVALDDPGPAADRLQPLLITVDPENDTVAGLKQALPKIHARLTGLTGSEEALAAARKSFGVETELVFTDPVHGPVYRHGAFIYLIDPEGTLLSVMPPILSSTRIAEIVRGHLAEG